MSKLLEAAVIEAAGGVVARGTPEGDRIAVIYRERYGPEWALPKGKRQSGETWQQAGLREVEEEIGVRPVITGVAGATAYTAGGVPKVVLYWRMRVDEDMTFTPNEEVKELAWLPFPQAIKRLTHSEEAHLLWSLTKGEGVGDGYLSRLERLVIPIARHRAWKRVATTIAASRRELEGRTASRAFGEGSLGIRNALDDAARALDAGEINGAWKFIHVAERLKILSVDGAELKATAMVIRAEAEKLGAWRKKAVLELLPACGCEDQNTDRVFQAAVLRDEHYNNEAYKDGIRRAMVLWLAFALAIGLFALLLLAWTGALDPLPQEPTAASPVSRFNSLLGLAVVGGLGAVFSAVTRLPSPDVPSRIPETIYSFRVTTLRLLAGPLSAIIIYFTTQSSLYEKIFSWGPPDGYALLVIAFAAGFTERLVVRVVEAVAGKSSS